jgi:signal transduction histidine kinase
VELVVTNLLRNAVEATDALMAGDPSKRSVIVNWGTRTGFHWISVLDRGEGLPAQASELFVRGVTLRDQGSGLGLTTASRAARSLGGTIELAPNDQDGTTAVFRWPAETHLA